MYSITFNIEEEYKSLGSGSTCFDTPSALHKKINRIKAFYGTATINGVVTEFTFSPYFDDGDIKSTDTFTRQMIKQFCKSYCFEQVSWLEELRFE